MIKCILFGESYTFCVKWFWLDNLLLCVDEFCRNMPFKGSWWAVPLPCCYICDSGHCHCNHSVWIHIMTFRNAHMRYESPLGNFVHHQNLFAWWSWWPVLVPGGRFKNTYELLNLRALKISHGNKIYIFQCMGKIFCVEFQRCPLKFHTKYMTHALKDMIFILRWNFKSS